MPRQLPPLPLSAQRAVRRLGRDISDARRRRRLPMIVVANRVGITRQTLHRVERGDPTVSLGIYASVLFVLGLIDKLAAVAGVEGDAVGLMLDEERLPKRVRQTVRPTSRAGGEE